VYLVTLYDLDLDLDPMTLILDLRLEVLKMYWHTKNVKFSGQHFQNLEPKQH